MLLDWSILTECQYVNVVLSDGTELRVNIQVMETSL